MPILIDLIFIIYTLALAIITVYCLLQLQLLYKYKKYHRCYQSALAFRQPLSEPAVWPFVTIQLPVFNEMYVVDRLVDNIMKLDYPKDRFEVHVLDDSTDETAGITRRKVAEYKAKGFHIEQILRCDRKGFKAGALKDAMPRVNGEFIAIFDADFMPKSNFLKSTLTHFHDKKVGVVQTRWEHLNENYSLITRLQALQLNAHFRVEQQGRQAGNYLLQFNGTAGVWRRTAIDDAGGWEADTLTEDLDLSIRAQLKGWKIVFLEEIGSPAELPSEMNGLKSQQFRWMKGGAETARKILPTVWHSHLSLAQKIHATLQLGGSTVFVCVFIMGVFSVPLLLFWTKTQLGTAIFQYGFLGMLALIGVHYTANVQAPGKEGGSFLHRFVKFILLFPLFLALSMGLSLHNSVAVLQGWLGKKSAFIRTPKFNIQGLTGTFRSRNYLTTKVNWTTLFEGLLALYFLLAAGMGLYTENFGFLPLHLILALGYGAIFYYTLRHLKVSEQ